MIKGQATIPSQQAVFNAQEISGVLWNWMFHYRTHNSMPLDLILGYKNPAHILGSIYNSV
jgi:hypothetical protein